MDGKCRVITFINEKGGIGKTSCCFNTAWELANRKRILMIDMDGQRANLTFFCGVEKTNSMKTMFNALVEQLDLNDIKVHVKENLDIIPAKSMVSEITSGIKIIRMIKAIQTVKDKYDYIFIDVNPSPTWSHALALSVSNYLIIPMLPDITSLEGNNGITESVEDIKLQGNKDLKILGIVFNKNDNRTNLSKEVEVVANKMAENLNTIVFDTKLRQGVAASENISEHKGVTEYARKSKIAADYKAFIKEFEKRIRKLEKEE